MQTLTICLLGALLLGAAAVDAEIVASKPDGPHDGPHCGPHGGPHCHPPHGPDGPPCPPHCKKPEKPPGVGVEGDCSFRVNGDIVDPAPLFTPQGKLEWLEPNSDGIVEIKNGKSIDMYCSSSFVAPFDNTTVLTAQCLQGQYFLVNGTIHPFAGIRCTDWPTYTARRTGRSCNNGTDLLEVGFEVSGGFLQTLDICHDETQEATRYVHHVLTPSNAAFQMSVMRPHFIQGDFYNGKNVDKLYTKVQQQETISEILGMNSSHYFNDTMDMFLARGHLAAKVDKIYASQQRSTFYFMNGAPQWQAFNGGNWERVEHGVRKYVAKMGLTTDCYTGTWGVSTLPDVNGVEQELYLAFDENNNGLIPVPRMFYRVVYDSSSGNAIVFVGVNNPHATMTQLHRDYVICPDISDRINWIDWEKYNLRKGYSYACSYPDFAAVVTDLPMLNTTGILGIGDYNDDCISSITTTDQTTGSTELSTEQPELETTDSTQLPIYLPEVDPEQ